jgi:hypothetical protein
VSKASVKSVIRFVASDRLSRLRSNHLPRILLRRFRNLLFRTHIVFRMLNAHDPFVEPRHNVVETFDAMPWLSRTRELVGLARKDNHRGWASQKLERAEQLFAA